METDNVLYKVALDAISEELKKEPQNGNLWLEHGRLSMLLGDKDTAMQSLRRAADIDPTLLQGISGSFDNKQQNK